MDGKTNPNINFFSRNLNSEARQLDSRFHRATYHAGLIATLAPRFPDSLRELATKNHIFSIKRSDGKEAVVRVNGSQEHRQTVKWMMEYRGENVEEDICISILSLFETSPNEKPVFALLYVKGENEFPEITSQGSNDEFDKLNEKIKKEKSELLDIFLRITSNLSSPADPGDADRLMQILSEV